LTQTDDRGPADFEWLDRDSILDLHQRSIEDYGGSFGIRDQGLLDSALNRPKHRWVYDEAPLSAADIAATYAVAIARNHAFVDGNKRTAFMAMVVFLALNGWALDVWQWKATRTMERVATGEIDEKELATWIRKHSRPLTDEEELELLDPDYNEEDDGEHDDRHRDDVHPR
jgi:death on curing protein